MLIVRALYGLNSAGAAFHAHLAKCMQGLGYEPCLADPDLWMKPEVRPDDHYEYYSYILFYVDYIMIVHHDALSILEKIDKYFTLKPTSIGDPDIYLGAKLRKMNLPNGVWCWGMSPSKYVQEAVRNFETHLKEHCNGKYSIFKDSVNPFAYNYEPEVDVYEPLDPDMASYYQSLIGIM